MRMNIAFLFTALCLVDSALFAQNVDEIRQATGIENGLVVHVGSTDGKLETELARTRRMLVHGLAMEEKACDRARQQIQQEKLYGLASVSFWHDSSRLPYADNLVNLLIADVDALGKTFPSRDEILRILVPGRGVAWLKQQGQWHGLRKPMTPGLDSWEQFAYNATGNIVSQDEHVKPSTGLQWINGTQEIADDNGYRFSGGKLVYRRRIPSEKADDATIRMTCRDAFNGLPFWARDTLGSRHGNAPLMGKHTPFIFTGQRIYTTLGTMDQPLVALDAETGQVVKTFDAAGTTFTRNTPRGEVLRKAGFFSDNYGKGHLVFFQGQLLHTVGKELFVLEAESGKRQWYFKTEDYLLLQRPVVNPDDKELYVLGCNKEARRSWGGGRNPGQRTAAILAFDVGTGKRKWTLPIDDRHITHAVYAERTLVVFSAQDNGPAEDEWIFAAVDTTTGKLRWSIPSQKDKNLWPGMQQRRELIIQNGKIYLMSHGVSAYDLQTGQAEFHFHGGNSRCEASKATSRYLLMAFSQFIDYHKDPPQAMRVALSRGSCGSGFFPAYGMVHYLPNQCHCENFIRFNTTASSEPVHEPIPDSKRLIRGEAESPAVSRKDWPARDEWPMFQRGPRRDNWTESNLPAKLRPLWTKKIETPPSPNGILSADWLDTNDYIGPISAPSIGQNCVFVAVREQHRIEARNAQTGELHWKFQAAGRIVTPPTIYAGICLFGCRDGWVYAIRADTGRLVWKFLAAPYERNLVAFSQVESTWPLLGSILVHDGLAFAVAGYHPLANGGLHLYALDPLTGEQRWHKVLDRKPEWVDIMQPRAQIDQPHPTARPIGGFQANVVVNNLAYAEGKYLRFSGVTLQRDTGELIPPPAKKNLGGTYDLETGPMGWLINSDKQPPFRRHYFTEGYFGPYGSGAQMFLVFPGASEMVGCVGYAFAGNDAVVLQGTKGEGLLRRYDTRKLISRSAVQSDQTPLWSRSIDGLLRDHVQGQKLYHYSSLIVAGDTIIVAGRLKGRGRSSETAQGPRQVAEGVIQTFDLRTGEPRQSMEMAAAPVVNGLAVAQGRLFAACEDGSLQCFGGE